MRVVMSPDDLGSDCYQLVLPLLAAVDQVVIWRPSLLAIDEMHSVGRLIFNSDEFIKLVEDGFVVVGARHPWYEWKVGRSSVPHWDSSPWTSKDGILTQLRNQDSSLPFVRRRAISIDSGDGEGWATRRVEEQPSLVQIVDDIIRKNNAPAGFMKHLNQCGSDHQKIITFIRDSRNLCNLEEEVAANISFWSPRFVQEIASVGNKTENISYKEISEIVYFEEAISMIADMSQNNTFPNWQKFLNSYKRKEFVGKVGPYLSSAHPRYALSRFLDESNPAIKTLDALQPTRSNGIAAFLGILLSAFGGLSGNSLLSMALSALAAPNLLGAKLGINEVPGADRVRWIFILSGETRVTFRSIREMRARILREPIRALSANCLDSTAQHAVNRF